MHRDLRVSLSDRCNLPCTYGMPADGLTCIPSPDRLIADVVDIVARLAAMPRAPQLSITTNGLHLAGLFATQRSPPMGDAGGCHAVHSGHTRREGSVMRAKPYEIQVLGAIPGGLLDGVIEDFPEVQVRTVLTGRVRDQSELQGLLRRLHHLGLELVAFRQLPPDASIGADETVPAAREGD